MDPRIKKITDHIKTLQDELVSELKDKQMPAQEFAEHVRTIAYIEIANNLLHNAMWKPSEK